MFRVPTLSQEHFASKWTVPAKDDMKSYEETNARGVLYANLPDSQQKEDLLLELIQAFDPYLKKYLNMVLRGHLPPLNTPSGSEAIKFLNLLASGNREKSSSVYGEICRTLHLAFKQ